MLRHRSQLTSRFTNEAVVLVVVLVVVLGSSSCYLGYSGSVESITLGLYPHEANASIYVAEDQGLFNRNGLGVTERNYDTGLTAVNGLLDGNVDVALTSEYIVVGNAFRKEDIRLMGNIRKGWSLDVVGRRDRGIENISDLKGKKIGVPLRTNAEFFLDRFLTLNGMQLRDVTLVDVKASPNVDAILDGSVDAVVVASNSITTIRERSGNNVVTWSAQGNQAVFWLLACRNDWIAGHAQTINKLLRSLDQANDYIIHYPSEAKAIVQKRMNYDAASMEARWLENQFALSLDESLIAAMEDEARWMIANNLTAEKQVPNFLNYIYLDGLEAVKPEAVNIIR
jgi:NitT/TauT family transport system substrate-binding protein